MLHGVQQIRLNFGIVPRYRTAVALQEVGGGERSGAFVAIGEQVMRGERVHECCCLLGQRGELLLPKDHQCRTPRRRFQQVNIAHKRIAPGHGEVDVVQVGDVQIAHRLSGWQAHSVTIGSRAECGQWRAHRGWRPALAAARPVAAAATRQAADSRCAPLPRLRSR